MGVKPCSPKYGDKVSVTSADLKTVEYAQNCRTLLIEFQDGSFYTAKDIPMSKYAELVSINKKKAKDPKSEDKSKSVGHFFHTQIKSSYKITKK